MKLDLTSFENAIASFEEAIRLLQKLVSAVDSDASLVNTVRSGVVQNFKFTYELAWKNMRRWLDYNLGSSKLDGVSRKELFRFAAQNKLIDDTKKWFEYHEARNKTSHTYKQEIAEEVVGLASGLLSDTKALLRILKSKND